MPRKNITKCWKKKEIHSRYIGKGCKIIWAVAWTYWTSFSTFEVFIIYFVFTTQNTHTVEPRSHRTCNNEQPEWKAKRKAQKKNESMPTQTVEKNVSDSNCGRNAQKYNYNRRRCVQFWRKMVPTTNFNR